MSAKSNDVTVSTYYAGLHFILGHANFDKITKILVGDKVAWEGECTGGDITIDKPDLFGGLTREGGVKGTLSIAMGEDTQTPNTYLQEKLGDVPAYRKVVSAIWQRGYLGTNYYLKEWQFEATRIHTLSNGDPQWYDEVSELSTSYTLNVIEITFEAGTPNVAKIRLYKDHGITLTSLITISGATPTEFNKTAVSPVAIGTDYVTYAIDDPGVLFASGDYEVTASVEGLMNGVHIIRECLTDTTWGYGRTNIDDTNFRAAALACFNEGLGFGFYWDDGSSLDDFINLVLEHIQATLYVDRITGLYKITLLRKLEDTSGLLDLTNHYGTVSKFSKKSLNDLASIYTVRYQDSNNGSGNQMTVQDFTLFVRQGIPIKKTKTYAGVIDPVTAYKIAQRDLLEITTPTYSFSIDCDRAAETLHKGDAFKITLSDYIDSELIMRVVSINLGTPTNRKITIECIQDTFTAAENPISNYIQSRWVSSINEPIALTNRLLNEVPYYVMAIRKGDSFAQSYNANSSAIIVSAESVTPDSYSAGLWSAIGTDYTRRSIVNFCYWDSLATDITKTSTTITVTTENDINLLYEGSFIQIDDELIQVINIAGTTLTVIRGVLDTVPEIHLTNASIIGWQDYSATDDIEYFITETVKVKLTTITPLGELPLADAPEDTITLIGRMHLPYPPADVKLNAAYWPTTVALADLTLTWATRNRIQQTAGLIGFYTGSITTEAGVTYSGELRKTSDDSLLDSFTGISATTYTFTTAYIGEVYFKLWSVRDGLDSWQAVTHTFTTIA